MTKEGERGGEGKGGGHCNTATSWFERPGFRAWQKKKRKRKQQQKKITPRITSLSEHPIRKMNSPPLISFSFPLSPCGTVPPARVPAGRRGGGTPVTLSKYQERHVIYKVTVTTQDKKSVYWLPDPGTGDPKRRGSLPRMSFHFRLSLCGREGTGDSREAVWEGMQSVACRSPLRADRRAQLWVGSGRVALPSARAPGANPR